MWLTLTALVACTSTIQPSPTTRPTGPEDSTASTPPQMPTSNSPALAVVGGVLLRQQSDGSLVPLSEATVYLAPVLYTTDNRQWLAGLDEANDPKALTNQTGVFIFSSVAPGTYGLVLKTPIGGYLLRRLDGTDLLIQAQAGQSLDLGEVVTDIQY